MHISVAILPLWSLYKYVRAPNGTQVLMDRCNVCPSITRTEKLLRPTHYYMQNLPIPGILSEISRFDNFCAFVRSVHQKSSLKEEPQNCAKDAKNEDIVLITSKKPTYPPKVTRRYVLMKRKERG